MNAEGNDNGHEDNVNVNDNKRKNKNNSGNKKNKITENEKSGYREARGDAHRRYLTSALVRTSKSRFSLSTLDPSVRVAGITDDHRHRPHGEQPHAPARRFCVLLHSC
uniref:Uncharacterized protein n=1 Tax=Vespula pensylvanica TaxID=30213 RepID=A0A834NY22_VESPE|nr:hypothetical protein H0235_010611 [Vespula pensylvanica]